MPDNGPTSTDEYKKQFAKRLYGQMQAKGMSQADLARQASHHLDKTLTRGSVNKYVAGVNLPSNERLNAMARALGCSAADLLPVSDIPTTASAPYELQQQPGGKAHLKVDMSVPISLALEIISKLAEYDEQRISDDN